MWEGIYQVMYETVYKIKSKAEIKENYGYSNKGHCEPSEQKLGVFLVYGQPFETN